MLIDPNAPFFRPLWVRIIVTAVPFLWSAYEMATGSVGWAVIFGAAGGYLFYELFLNRSAS